MPKDQQFAARKSQQVAADKKRSRQLDWEDTRRPAWVAWLSVLCLIALLVSILALSSSDRVSKPQNINGDQLGPFDVATSQEYFAESEQQLEQVRWVPPETMPALLVRWMLHPGRRYDEAKTRYQPFDRIVDDHVLMSLPELYKHGRLGEYFNLRLFLIYMLDATVQVSLVADGGFRRLLTA